MKANKIRTLVSSCALMFCYVSTGGAADVKLPETLSWSAYGTGSSGYNQSVAIGKTLKDSYGVNLRVIPGKNDISRLTPLRSGKVQFVANGGATYFASEGISLFAAREWGPMKVRLLMSSTGRANIQVAVAADSGIKDYKDLKGKKVAYVIGSDALNIGVEAILAFADLTWDDVQKVEFPGYGASWEGVINGQADAVFGSTVTGPSKKLEASPRGIFWPSMSPDDSEGWMRLSKVAPYILPHTATIGAGNVSKETPLSGVGYPYPILITMADQKDELVYSMTKAIHTEFPNFKDAMPALSGWAVENQPFMWAVPYHQAAVSYWKEIGVWTDEMQAHNDGLINRQNLLSEAWATMSTKNISDDDAFKQEWLKVRKKTLVDAGLNP